MPLDERKSRFAVMMMAGLVVLVALVMVWQVAADWTHQSGRGSKPGELPSDPTTVTAAPYEAVESPRESVARETRLRITDPDGQGVPGATLYAAEVAGLRSYAATDLRPIATSDRDGGIVLGATDWGESGDALNCIVRASGYATAELEVCLGRSYTVALSLAPPVQVRCQLVTGEPVEGAVVALSRAFPSGVPPADHPSSFPGAGFAAVSYATTDRDGVALVRGLAHGSYTVYATKRGLAPVEQPTLFHHSARDEPCRIRFDQIFVAVSQIADPEPVATRPWVLGTNVVGHAAESLRQVRHELQQAFPGAGVVAVLLRRPLPDPLPALQWQAVFSDRAPHELTASLEAFSDSVAFQSLRPRAGAAPWGRISITVDCDDDGRSFPDLYVRQLSSSEGRSLHVRVPSNRSLGLSPGRYRIESRSLSPHIVIPKVVTVLPGSDEEVVLETHGVLDNLTVAIESASGAPTRTRLQIEVFPEASSRRVTWRRDLVLAERVALKMPRGRVIVTVKSHGYRDAVVETQILGDTVVTAAMEPQRWN